MRLSAAFLSHILPAMEMLRISLFGPPKRHIQPERYAKFCLKFTKNVLETIDKVKMIEYI
jgi:hypothetical protein